MLEVHEFLTKFFGGYSERLARGLEKQEALPFVSDDNNSHLKVSV